MPDIELLQMIPAEHETAPGPNIWSTDICDAIFGSPPESNIGCTLGHRS